MQIIDLKLVNFRNYDKLKLEFDKKLNLIIGKNGSGKTNLVEAIYVLALTKSFRTNNDEILIKSGESITKIEANIKGDLTNNYVLVINNDGKKVKINQTNATRLSDYISKVNVILFSPNDLRIIKDTPSVRRKMLNIEISQLNNLYLKNLQNYNKIIKQRNSYLKTLGVNGNSSQDYLDILTNKLVDIGLFINEKRKKFIELINENIGDLFFKITNTNKLKIEYLSDYNNITKENLLKLYKKSIDRDLMFGKTFIGIHHDDIVFKINDKNLKEYGSEGQQKNAIISFKLAEINIFNKLKSTNPILILDDLFSELDTEKINNILNILDNNIQTFITTTEIDKVKSDIIEKCKIIKINETDIEEVTYEK